MMGWSGVFQRWVHPLVLPHSATVVALRGIPRRACQMLSRLSSRPVPHRSKFRPSVRAAPTMPFADFCPAVKTSFPVFSRCRFRCNDTEQISRGKTRILPRIDAGFTKCTLVGVATDAVDRGLGGHVPAGPECISLAGRPGARGTYSSPVTNSPQGLFVSGLSLISGFCSSSRDFALGFLRTPPRDDALALWLTFGSTLAWYRDLHPTGFVRGQARPKAVASGPTSYALTT